MPFLAAAAIFVAVSHAPHQVNILNNARNNGYGEKKKPRHIKLRKHGLKIRWRRPAWIQAPPPAPKRIGLLT